jgi:hypothetical protein
VSLRRSRYPSIQGSVRVADRSNMAATTVLNPPDSEVVSPELVLIDPDLRERLRSSARPAWEFPSEERTIEQPHSCECDGANGASSSSTVVSMLALLLAGRTRAALIVAAATSAAVGLVFSLATHVPSAAFSPSRSEQTPLPANHARTHKPRHEGSLPDRPSNAAHVTGQSVAWAPSPEATGYKVELFRKGVRVFAARTAGTSMILPTGTRRLPAGTYTWYVWPVVRGHRDQAAIVSSPLVITDRG